eukprot:362907-Chlamydomonas_euryale.AAC.13
MRHAAPLQHAPPAGARQACMSTPQLTGLPAHAPGPQVLMAHRCSWPTGAHGPQVLMAHLWTRGSNRWEGHGDALPSMRCRRIADTNVMGTCILGWRVCLFVNCQPVTQTAGRGTFCILTALHTAEMGIDVPGARCHKLKRARNGLYVKR